MVDGEDNKAIETDNESFEDATDSHATMDAQENAENTRPKEAEMKTKESTTIMDPEKPKTEPPQTPQVNLQDLPPLPLPPSTAEGESPSESVTSPPTRNKFFGWISRNASAVEKSIKSPPLLPGRRNTASSNLSLSDISIKHADGGDTSGSSTMRPHRNSLKDRFKLARLREEHGLGASANDETVQSPTDAPTASVDKARALNEVEEELASSEGRQRTNSGNVTDLPGETTRKPTLNTNLAPGTAAGTSVGPPPDAAGPVDWDLWQAVVEEGPAAVTRSSADELNRAITAGIPSAIRGVVWQVLADSKSEDLEDVYRDLVRRGADGERRRSATLHQKLVTEHSRRGSTATVSVKEPAAASKASSIHSHKSGGSSPAGPGSRVASPERSAVDTASSELPAKGQEEVAVEEKLKKVQDEQQAVQRLEKAIKRDLGTRTSFSKFLISAGLQNGLFGICKAYALFDEEVGYAQGMNFVAMPLLFNMPEEEAFCLFVRLMNKYRLRELFKQDMPGLHLHLYQFERLLEDLEPALYCHLNRRGVYPQLYATQWFLTLFAYRFPLQLVLRIYDLILSEGLESAILKFGMVLMHKNAAALLEMKDMAVLTTFLKEKLFDVYIDSSPSSHSVLESGFFGSAGGVDKEVYRSDELVRDACAVQITAETLKTYASEWEEKSKAEKEKLAAEEALRTTAAALTLQVRQLQQQTEKSDTEHVQIASELVKIQLENQKLKDDNESLRTQVTELQDIIQAQPGEVEEKLKVEMDRIISRNSEVQNQNRLLSENFEELEKELVAAKIEKAEMNSELEAMKKKWSSISTMMNGNAAK